MTDNNTACPFEGRELTDLPIFDQAEKIAEVGRNLYDALELLAEQAAANAVTKEALANAHEALSLARGVK